MLALFGTMSDFYYSTIVFLLQNPVVYHYVVTEIREGFESYEYITSEQLVNS